METSIQQVITSTLLDSNARRIHFGQVVGNLISVGVESYWVDYRGQRVTYYMPCGETLSLDLEVQNINIASYFSTAEIKALIGAAQRGEIMYPEFKQLSQAAGCIGYVVWIEGKQVSYFGRKGEVHIELFPSE